MRPGFSLFEIFFGYIIIGAAAFGSGWGFFGLVFGLIAGYLTLSALECISMLACGSQGRARIRKQVIAARAKRIWLSNYPACDLRDLNLEYRLQYTVAHPILAFVSFVGAANLDHQLSWHEVVSGICASVVSTILCAFGLTIIWGWMTRQLGATAELSSSLSKPFEMGACYVLLGMGFLWIATAAYFPKWISSVM